MAILRLTKQELSVPNLLEEFLQASGAALQRE